MNAAEKVAEEVETELVVEDPNKGLKPKVFRDIQTDEVTVSFVPSSGNDVIVMANTPAGLAQGQGVLLEWAERKLVALQLERDHAQANLDEAKESKVKTSGWAKEVKKWDQRLIYYRKLKAALDAGYYIVPDFPINVIAVRTKKTKPTDAGTVHRYPSGVRDEPAQRLTIGEGEYQDPVPPYFEKTVEVARTNGKGEKTTDFETHYETCDEFDVVDFPLRLVRPQVLRDFRNSMKAKIFDEIGVLPDTRRKADPMVIGRIHLKDGSGHKSCSFLISWWIPTQAL